MSTEREPWSQLYDTADIYKSAYAIMRDTQVVAAHMGKLYKYSIGSIMVSTVSVMTVNVALAYCTSKHSPRKLEHIRLAKEHAHVLLINTRVAYDLQQISPRETYVNFCSALATLLKKLGGWEESVANGESGQPGQSEAIPLSFGAPLPRSDASEIPAELKARFPMG